MPTPLTESAKAMSDNVCLGHTLVDILCERAQRKPHELAYQYLQDGEATAIQWTYETLSQRAAAIGSLLQLHAGPGTRVLLVYDPGLEYIAAFLGCLYAGTIAVPAQPPRRKRACSWLQQVLADCGAEIALTTNAISSSIEQQLHAADDLASLRWLTTDDLPGGHPIRRPEPAVSHNTVAFLQYTSGSTGDPKGVIVTHGNLIHNLSAVRHGFQIDPKGMGVTWLPMYHDMGLIGGILEPLFVGGPATILSPVAFVQNPARWLQAISRYQGTISGGPTFAYRLCIEKISPAQRSSLDLSSWQVAFCGAEPVCRETLSQFAQTFAPCGFREEAFYPCYGMAESTLMISGGKGSAAPTSVRLRNQQLRKNRVVLADEDDAASQTFVACGRASLGQKIVVADPTTRTRCGEDRVGEIWTSGPSVTRGYWNNPELTEQTFAGYLVDSHEGPYLRTGDLGFIHDGELYVTGRLKDLIIIRGQNHAAQDIERSVERCSSALRCSGGAAFSLLVAGQERLVIVHEVERGTSEPNVDQIAADICLVLSENHGLVPYAIVLVKPHSIPRTTSGKIRRTACRDALENNQLKVVAKWLCDQWVDNVPANPDTVLETDDATSASQEAASKIIQRWLIHWLSRKLELPPHSMDVRKPLALFGVSSLTALEMSADLADWLRCHLEPDIAIAYPTIDALSLHLARRCSELGIHLEPAGDEPLDGQKNSQSDSSGRRQDRIRRLLSQHDGVQQAEVLEHRQENGATSLLAFFTPQRAAIPSLIGLRNLLRQQLPDCPATLTLVPLETIPRTESGRLDRGQLLAMLKTKPRNSVEERLADAWSEILKIDNIGIYENLYSLGGGAVDRVKIAALAIEAGLRLTPQLVQDYPTMAELGELSSGPNPSQTGQHRGQARGELDRTSQGQDCVTKADGNLADQPSHTSMVIESLGVYLPARVVSTDEVLQSCEKEVTFPLELATGIRSRRMAGESEFSIELATKAMQQCLSLSRKKPTDIDLLICCSISRHAGPNRMSFEPGTSMQLKEHFGLTGAVAFDMNNACAGMFTAMKIAEAYLATGSAHCAMVVSGEFITHLTRTAQKEIEGFKDERLACLTLGDAGAALILENSSSNNVGFHDIDIYTLGRYSDLCIGKATDREHGGAIMYSQPSKLASIGIKHAVLHSASTCARNLWSRDTAHHIIMHQTSESSINSAVQAMNLLANKTIEASTINNLAERGNTASTSQFVAVWDGILDGRIKSGQRVMFPISASGQTVGTALYTFDDLPDRLRAARLNGQKPAHTRSRRRRHTSRRRSDGRIRIESIGLIPPQRSVPDRSTVQLAVSAAKHCLKGSRYCPNDIDLLIYTGVYRSDFLSEPAVAAMIAGELGMNADVDPLADKKTLAFDICNSSLGSLNACDLARQMITAGRHQTVMVVASEIENNATVRPTHLRGLKETASAMILDKSSSGNEGFGRLSFKYFTGHIGALRCEARLANGKPYLQLDKHPRVEDLFLECIADSVRQFTADEFPDADPPAVILPPQISSAFLSRLARRLNFPDRSMVNIAETGSDLFTSSLAYTLAAAKDQGMASSGEVGLIIDVGAGIQVACATYRF